MYFNRLNDAAIRLNAGAQLAVWLVLGSQFAGLAGADYRIVLPLVLVACLLALASLAIGLPLFFRANRRLLRELADASGAYVARGVEGEFAPARVVRSRSAAGVPGFLAGYPTPVEPTARIVVLHALAAQGPRRVLALVPASWQPHLPNRALAAVRLASPDTDVAVLDGRVDAATLGQIAADPRWRTSLPHGPIGRELGWIGAAAVLGLAVGFGVPMIVNALIG
ncbi:hypothetical protein ACWDR7_01085 [Microbacterium sp. NPDC003461]